jgi:AraC family transcriptional activator of pobA
MQDYARTLGVTPTHLTRTCKTCSGMTASDLLTRRLLHAARDLLETTNHPANRIAATLGFRSAAYFSRFVLHHTGQTPTALRKQNPTR